jgi:hypothetical protein
VLGGSKWTTRGAAKIGDRERVILALVPAAQRLLAGSPDRPEAAARIKFRAGCC